MLYQLSYARVYDPRMKTREAVPVKPHGTLAFSRSWSGLRRAPTLSSDAHGRAWIARATAKAASATPMTTSPTAVQRQ